MATNTVVYNFSSTVAQGQRPMGNVLIDGSIMYGVATQGGAYFRGVLFSADISQVPPVYTKLHDFGGPEVTGPSGLVQDGSVYQGGSDVPILIGSKLYGTCSNINGSEYSIYSVNTNGTDYRIIFSSLNPVGNGGMCSLNGLLYGVSSFGGAGAGYIYSINTDGTNFTPVYTFTIESYNRPSGSLIGHNNILYGCCEYQGIDETPSVFSYDLGTSTFTNIKTFQALNIFPTYRVLTFDSTYTNVYGYGIGNTGFPEIFSYNISTSTYSVLHTLTSTEGFLLSSKLVYNNGILYGASVQGQFGLGNTIPYGNVFSMNSDGTNFTVENVFGQDPDGNFPFGIGFYNGYIYGTTYSGGSNEGGEGPPGAGTIFTTDPTKAGGPRSGGGGGGGGRVPCFKEGSKILCKVDGKDVYVPIQNLRKGDLVKTVNNGYKAVEMIGVTKLLHMGLSRRIKDQLYVCSSAQYPEVVEDLVLTGAHSVLVDNFKNDEQKQAVVKLLGDTYVTDRKYRLPACIDDRTSVYTQRGSFKIYHLALENVDYYGNYGVYANGLLVETCSRRYLKELSRMTLL